MSLNKAEARKLEHPGALKGKIEGILALIILRPRSNFLGFAVEF